MNSLMTIPVEVAHQALSFCAAWDIVAFARTCHLAHALALESTGQPFWRDVFCTSHFDDPRNAWRLPGDTPTDIDWRDELQQRLSAELLAARPKRLDNSEAYEAMLAALIRVLHDIVPLSADQPESLNVAWLDKLLKYPGLLNDDVSRLSPAGQRLHALLRAYTGHVFDESTPENSLRYRRSVSRTYAYDMRNYTRANTWAPLAPATGHVDWVHLDHIATVVVSNVRDVPFLGEDQIPPLGLQHARAYTAPGEFSKRDWAGVEGTWRRYVCFMDYRELAAFNTPLFAEGARDLSFFDRPAFREAVRLLSVDIRIIECEELEAEMPEFIGVYDEPPPDFPYPPIYFEGHSETADGGHLHLEGCVMMGIDGTVRWYFVSSLGGEYQWSSRGVQIGGIGSATGVVGVWTTTTHEAGDPAGPYWQWKVPSEDPEYAPLLDRV
ncbi:hypothetical protein BD626DRAFT_486382 [Schizophyllum amplum]|uniref:F-box domain-containing protein n=1 Tax=Schizophyllum amplum TaxID=97359 RepID=A0A550CME3_9AGAR|nr:hypothetical protein BD626DRAFT_486382 [Auriculariopsis ampla]